jgi:hypothetical protein
VAAVVLLIISGCSKTYQVKPLAFRMPSAYGNMQMVSGAQVAAEAFSDKKAAQEAFGFDILGAGMLPVQVVFDNLGDHALEINGAQSFLENSEGRLWPILSTQLAYERATRGTTTQSMVKDSAFHGVWGAAAGALIGAAVGIVGGDNVAVAAGKGAAIGGAAGATIGSASGYNDNEARRAVVTDLREKSLQNRPVDPKSIAHGFLFFPSEALSAQRLRLQIQEKDTGNVYVLTFDL